jgi:hypothetical protein
METTATNGKPATAREVLDSLSKIVEKLEGDLQRQESEIRTLRDERDEARFMVEEYKRFIRELPEWEKFDPAEYTCTIDDILAELESK